MSASVPLAPVLQVRALELSRAGQLLQPPLTFQVEPKTVLAVVGRSGVGKSTLLRTLAGLLTPRAERLLLLGEDRTHASAETWAQLRSTQLGLLEQELGLLPHLSVERNILLPCLLSGQALQSNLPRVDAMLQALGLAAVRHRPASTLSRGQAQRVALIRALLPKRALLLLDEPDASLDREARGWARAHIQAAAEAGAAVILSTHDPESVALAHRVLKLEVAAHDA